MRRAIGQWENQRVNHRFHVEYGNRIWQLFRHYIPIDMENYFFAGFGWATIKLKNLNATHLRNAVSTINTFAGPREAVNTCDQSWSDRDQLCDPYVIVKIGESFKKNDVVLTTEAKKDTQKYYVNRFVMSGLIQKNKTYIEIEVLDENGDGKPPDRLIWTSGTVEQFMRVPYRCSNNAKIRNKFIPGNCIEVDVVWQDQRAETKPQTTEHENIDAATKG